MRPARPGSGLMRAATAAGIEVQVVAPSKTPRAPGDRVKTDRKDAVSARLLLRGGCERWRFHPSGPSDPPPGAPREAVRHDRCGPATGSREDSLLVHGRLYPGEQAWGRDAPRRRLARAVL